MELEISGNHALVLIVLIIASAVVFVADLVIKAEQETSDYQRCLNACPGKNSSTTQFNPQLREICLLSCQQFASESCSADTNG